MVHLDLYRLTQQRNLNATVRARPYLIEEFEQEAERRGRELTVDEKIHWADLDARTRSN